MSTKAKKANLDLSLMKNAYKKMLFIRRFEEECIELYKQGLIGGSLHSYIGQEAVAVGVIMNLRKDDYITMTYRGRGHALAKGADEKKLLAEMLGRVDGYCRGKGGPMHIVSVEHGILGANAIVGGGIPIAVGAALSAQYQENDRVTVTFFGDGTVNQGAFHEALNIAAIWDLPVVFVCENNLYSEMTRIADMVKNEDLAERAAAYGMPGVVVDGNDLESVYQVAKNAIDVARQGGGPTLIEAKTYRLVGHMYGDSETYRTKEEVELWRKREPLKRLRERILEKDPNFNDEIERMEREISNRLNQAVEFAKKSPEPDLTEIFEHVY